MSKNVIGVDPGLGGAIVLIGNFSPIVIPMPVKPSATGTNAKRDFDVAGIHSVIYDIYSTSRARELWIEKPGEFPFIKQACEHCGEAGPPRKPAAGARSQGYCHGLFEMACLAYGIDFNVVPAKVWQHVMFAGMHGKNPKELSIARATQMFPDVPLRRTTRCTTDDDGIADALCIATYGQRVLSTA